MRQTRSKNVKHATFFHRRVRSSRGQVQIKPSRCSNKPSGLASFAHFAMEFAKAEALFQHALESSTDLFGTEHIEPAEELQALGISDSAWPARSWIRWLRANEFQGEIKEANVF